ncbi:hypothetical protein EAI_11074 [Harpegnathos saltator]|uniref:MARVEL domain-containing protein n=1 Tax=Harpegnathos saltator TaxID=610380 RepID=E2BFA6_HARSA|nr:hypothetical protein EAI_11074 [Harpegnathos saltator]
MIGQPHDFTQSYITPVACEDIPPVAKPIRVIQFLLVAAIFALTVYTISSSSPYEKIEELLLTSLYTTFLFIAVIDMISQLSGEPITDTPMFLFGVVGTVLFLMAAFGIFFVTNRAGVTQIWRLMTSIALSSVCSLLYLLDVLLIYLYGY